MVSGSVATADVFYVDGYRKCNWMTDNETVVTSLWRPAAKKLNLIVSY